MLVRSNLYGTQTIVKKFSEKKLKIRKTRHFTEKKLGKPENMRMADRISCFVHEENVIVID